MDKRRRMPNDCAALIKARLTMPEVLARYGVRLDRHQRIQCFLHGGRDRNMRVYEHKAHCFVCNQSADVIDYMMCAFGLDYAGAVEQLDHDFALGLTGSQSRDKTAQIRAEIAARRNAEDERIAALQVKCAAMDRLSGLYWAVWTARERCEPFSDGWCAATDIMNRADVGWWDEFNEMARLEDARRGI